MSRRFSRPMGRWGVHRVWCAWEDLNLQLPPLEGGCSAIELQAHCGSLPTGHAHIFTDLLLATTAGFRTFMPLLVGGVGFKPTSITIVICLLRWTTPPYTIMVETHIDYRCYIEFLLRYHSIRFQQYSGPFVGYCVQSVLLP